MDGASATNVRLGWLWFDNDPKTSLQEKVAQAASRYQQKFGQQPLLCYVSQTALPEAGLACGRVRIMGVRNVLPGHFLFVVETEEPQRLAA